MKNYNKRETIKMFLYKKKKKNISKFKNKTRNKMPTKFYYLKDTWG